jgi:hypothetical protein
VFSAVLVFERCLDGGAPDDKLLDVDAFLGANIRAVNPEGGAR